MRSQYLMLLGYLLLNMYLVFAWDVWWYGGSFGARGMVQVYALLALPMAALFSWMWRKWAVFIPTLAFILACSWMNLFMTWQAHSSAGLWEPEYMTKAYFWKIFGKTSIPKMDRKFLHVADELTNEEAFNIRVLYANDFESDTVAGITDRFASSGQYSWVTNQERQFSPGLSMLLSEINAKPDSWTRVSAQLYYERLVSDIWGQGSLVMIFLRDGAIYSQTYCRVQELLEPNQWQSLSYEMRIPVDVLPTDELRVYVWNSGSANELFVDDLKVELLEPRNP